MQHRKILRNDKSEIKEFKKVTSENFSIKKFGGENYKIHH